ncbi:unnamed protein product [Clavelina lepadiformis]|uniref:Glutathione hydrolase n=1 Tax=Clavelina lepadiformis TaxID=159417 RepID=A0ABP0FCM9_CLALP
MEMVHSSQYHRVSTESDDDDTHGDMEVIQESSWQRQDCSRNKPGSPWTCTCISRLLVSYVLLIVALGFAISRIPVHKFHHHHQGGQPLMAEEHHHHVYMRAAVAAGHKDCSEAGVSILRDGGNAVDAAIATLLCQGVLEPQFSGIGGGFFMTIYNKTRNSSTVVDAREIAPKLSTPTMFQSINGSIIGPTSIAVPGELKGFRYAYEKYGGDVEWSKLFLKAINKSENGFKITPKLAEYLKQSKDEIVNSKELCNLYCDNSRTDVKNVDDVVHNVKLAQTLRQISENGTDMFYNGTMAQQFAEELKPHAGIITAEDFANYNVEEKEAMKIQLPFLNKILVVPPLPSGGPILGMIMLIMDSYNITSEIFGQNTTLCWHRTVEAFKHAFAARTKFEDPDFNAEVLNLTNTLLSPENIQYILQRIINNKTFSDPGYYGAKSTSSGPQTSTTHVSVLAPNGDAVSVTSTINNHFGSFFLSPSTGVLFNNEMADFVTQVGDDGNLKVNLIEPGKRPQSSMAPCIVVEKSTNNALYIIGAAGGRQIPTSIALSLIRLLYFGAEDFDDAIVAPRIHHQLIPDVLKVEKLFDGDVLRDLEKIGHKIALQPPMSHVNGIKNHVSHIHAYSDFRDTGAEADGW